MAHSRSWGLAGSAVATLIAFAILVSLGTWQMQRKSWKEHLLAQIAERTKAEPRELAEALASGAGDPEYLHVRVSGRFLHDKEQYLWTPDPAAGPGYNVYTPLQLASGEVVWVNRGYVPQDRRAPETRTDGQLTGDVTVTGLVRKPALRTAFTPDNEAYRRVYYWRALDEMQAAAFAAGTPQALPFFVDADAEPANPGGLPRGGATLVALPNRHLEYALTWYGLAATLLAVYGVFIAARLRRTKSAPGTTENR